MFAAAVDAVERLFVQKARKVVLFRNLFHRFHDKLVLVGRDVCGRENRRKLVLSGRDFVMLRLCGDAEFPEFAIQIFHKKGDAVTDCRVILVGLFLSFCGGRAEQSTSRVLQVFALHIVVFVDQKIFLLAADDGSNFFGFVVAKNP